MTKVRLHCDANGFRLRFLARHTALILFFLLAPLERNSRYRRLPRLAIQIVGPLGRQVQHINSQADRPHHRNPEPIPIAVVASLFTSELAAGSGSEDIQRPHRSPGEPPAPPHTPPSTGWQESPESRPSCTRFRPQAEPGSCPSSPGSTPSICPHSGESQRALWPPRSRAR